MSQEILGLVPGWKQRWIYLWRRVCDWWIFGGRQEEYRIDAVCGKVEGVFHSKNKLPGESEYY